MLSLVLILYYPQKRKSPGDKCMISPISLSRDLENALHYRHSVQFSCSVMSNSLWPHGLQHARLPCPSPTFGAYSNSCPLCQVMPCSHLILYHPLLLPPSIFPNITVFSNESILHIRWPKYWSFSLSLSPSNEYSGLISFMIDWFDLAVQGTLKSLLPHHTSKASIQKHWDNSRRENGSHSGKAAPRTS